MLQLIVKEILHHLHLLLLRCLTFLTPGGLISVVADGIILRPWTSICTLHWNIFFRSFFGSACPSRVHQIGSGPLSAVAEYKTIGGRPRSILAHPGRIPHVKRTYVLVPVLIWDLTKKRSSNSCTFVPNSIDLSM